MTPQAQNTLFPGEKQRTNQDRVAAHFDASIDTVRRALATHAYLAGQISAAEAAAAIGVTTTQFRLWMDQSCEAHLAKPAEISNGRLPAQRPDVSIVMPVFNEAENINELYLRLSRALPSEFVPEFIFVNDGSTDTSAELIRKLQRENSQIKLINLSRNFGHQAAITAGLHFSSGAAVIILDSDLQDPPELTVELLKRWQAGAKVVYGVRSKRRDGLFKRAAYFTFYRALRLLSHVEIPLDSGDCCLLDRAVVDRLNALPERNRFLRGLRSWVGFSQAALPYERDKRYAGRPKYNFRRLVKLAVDGIFSFSAVPLRLATYLGLIVCVFGAAFLVFAVLAYFEKAGVPVGWTSIVALILVMGGTQLFMCGILGEYVARIYDESKQRPLYVIDSFIDPGLFQDDQSG